MRAGILWVLAVLVCLSGCLHTKPNREEVQLYYEESAQVEIVSPRGVRILIDVDEPKNLVQQPTAEDILLTTHLHPDHYLARFAAGFAGQQLKATEGSIAVQDVRIRGIAASHTALPPEGATGSNYIFIMDIGALRVVHLGDTEQRELTAEQVAAIGKPDVVLGMLFAEDSGKPDDRSVRIFEQIRPLLIIPTHIGIGGPELARARWRCCWSDRNPLFLSKNYLPRETSLVFMGSLASAFGELLKVSEWKTR